MIFVWIISLNLSLWGRCEKNQKYNFDAFVQNKDDHRLTKLTNKQTNSKNKMSREHSFNSNIDKRQSNTLLHYLTVKCEIPIFGGYHPSTIRFCKPSFSGIQFIYVHIRNVQSKSKIYILQRHSKSIFIIIKQKGR